LFKFTKAMIEGKSIDVYNYGKMKRDFTYIDDIAEAIIRLQDVIPQADADWTVETGSPATSSRLIAFTTSVTARRSSLWITSRAGRSARQRSREKHDADSTG
jgi:nucleoside-diphosphate-sugar epimerase